VSLHFSSFHGSTMKSDGSMGTINIEVEGMFGFWREKRIEMHNESLQPCSTVILPIPRVLC
jgi:hypothetical protein